MDWASVAVHFRLNGKMVEAIVEGTGLGGLAHRPWQPLHGICLDEVSRRQGPQSLTIVSALQRGRVVWVGWDRTTATMDRFFAWLGPRRARAIPTVWCDMWAVSLDTVHAHLPHATIVFDRFPLSQHLSRTMDEVRRQTWRELREPEKAECKKTRFLWLSNPDTLRREERTRLSGLLRLNSPIVKASLLKEDLCRFWDSRSTAWAEAPLRQWLWRAAHSRLEPFKQLARMLRVLISTGCWPGPGSA